METTGSTSVFKRQLFLKKDIIVKFISAKNLIKGLICNSDIDSTPAVTIPTRAIFTNPGVNAFFSYSSLEDIKN